MKLGAKFRLGTLLVSVAPSLSKGHGVYSRNFSNDSIDFSSGIDFFSQKLNREKNTSVVFFTSRVSRARVDSGHERSSFSLPARNRESFDGARSRFADISNSRTTKTTVEKKKSARERKTLEIIAPTETLQTLNESRVSGLSNGIRITHDIYMKDIGLRSTCTRSENFTVQRGRRKGRKEGRKGKGREGKAKGRRKETTEHKVRNYGDRTRRRKEREWQLTMQ